MKNKRFLGMKRVSALVLSLLVSCGALFSACDSKSKKAEDSSTEAASEAATEKATEETTESTTEEATEVTTESETEATEESSPAPGEYYIPADTPYEKVTLDGIKEHHFIATDYCYIEEEKFVLLIEKDIDLPGDFADNVSAIIDEIEKQLGVSYAPDDHHYVGVTDNTVHYGMNPWEGWQLGKKIPIFLEVDPQNEGLISGATADETTFVMYELFSEDFWNSTSGFYDVEWRVRPEYVDYATIAHELTHTITLRQCDLTTILAEGIAQYMGGTVVDALAADHPSIAEFKENRYDFDYSIPEAVNASNAETIFLADYNEIDTAGRGAEYTYGKYLWKFLHDEYGEKFFSDAAKGFRPLASDDFDIYGEYDAEIVGQYADVLKKLYGDDVFTKFGKWCTKNHYLQEAS